MSTKSRHNRIAPNPEFGTKAETLARLELLLKSGRVLPQVAFTVREWKEAPQRVVLRIREVDWKTDSFIVRSSATSEDTYASSNAGHYTSVLDVKGEEALRFAIAQVIGSYGQVSGAEQVFVQPMLSNVVMSGVVMGEDSNTGSPYIVVSFDDTSGSTSSVTSGNSQNLKSFYYWRGSKVPPPSKFVKIIAALTELEALFGTRRLDVEFALTSDGEIYVLQCRPMTNIDNGDRQEQRVMDALLEIENKIGALNRPHPYLLGTRTVFGVMPDWNPAEIIGIRPRPLALSLYKELVTDRVWAYQRDNYGYRNLRSFPLLISFCGLPYIDVRVSFNSFIPAGIDQKLGERLLNYYIDSLIAAPNNHDKVEFAVVFTCYTLDLTDRLDSLRKVGFSEGDCAQLTHGLRSLTKTIMDRDQGLWRKDLQKISTLESRLNTIKNSNLDTVSKIYWLLEDCKRYGTLPFAGLARAGFIAVQMLRSLVSVGILNEKEYNSFLGSIETINVQMARDLAESDRKAFLAKYGHLRPGTYDILSPRYDEEPEKYFSWASPHLEDERSNTPFSLGLEQLNRLRLLLREHQLGDDILGFFDFIKSAIAGRELAKFIFTRSLSESLSLLRQLGEAHGFSSEDTSFLNVSCVNKLYSSSVDLKDEMAKSIEEGRRSYEITKRISLPPLIVKTSDVWAFELAPSDPNFITQNSVTGPVVFPSSDRNLLKGAIFLIPSADPGYDWIFTHGIGGLITMYGGVNSHMAIRAGELGIPAVIGAGQTLFNRWASASQLHIDCTNRVVHVIR